MDQKQKREEDMTMNDIYIYTSCICIYLVYVYIIYLYSLYTYIMTRLD